MSRIKAAYETNDRGHLQSGQCKKQYGVRLEQTRWTPRKPVGAVLCQDFQNGNVIKGKSGGLSTPVRYTFLFRLYGIHEEYALCRREMPETSKVRSDSCSGPLISWHNVESIQTTGLSLDVFVQRLRVTEMPRSTLLNARIC